MFSTTFRSVLSSSLSSPRRPTYLSVLSPPISLSSRCPFVSLVVLSLAAFLPVDYPADTTAYLLDYLVLGTGYSVPGTRYPVYTGRPPRSAGHATPEQTPPRGPPRSCPPSRSSSPPLSPSAGGIPRFFVSISREAHRVKTHRELTHSTSAPASSSPLRSPLLLLLASSISSASSHSSCYRLLVASLRESPPRIHPTRPSPP